MTASRWAIAGSSGSSPMTTKGDLYTYDSSDQRLAVGTNTYVLTADSSTATGLKWAAPSGGGVTDGDKGDITVSGTGATWTIDAATITLAKMAPMATASILGRTTTGSGSPEVLSVSGAKALLAYTYADVGADVAGAATSAVSTHVGLSDPHAQYALESALGSLALVADAPSDGSTYGRLNGAWAVAGGSGLTHPQIMTRANLGRF